MRLERYFFIVALGSDRLSPVALRWVEPCSPVARTCQRDVIPSRITVPLRLSPIWPHGGCHFLSPHVFLIMVICLCAEGLAGV